jgi:hypothetical protein
MNKGVTKCGDSSFLESPVASGRGETFARNVCYSL